MIVPLIFLVVAHGTPGKHPQAETATCRQPSALFLDRAKHVIEENPHYELKVYTAERAQALIKAINADPPETNFVVDEIYVITKKEDGEERMLVFLSRNKCIEQILPIPISHWRELTRKAIGTDS